MSSTSSTAHRRDFCRALYLQPSSENLGRGAWGSRRKGRTKWMKETKETKETTTKQSIKNSLCCLCCPCCPCCPCCLQIINLARSTPHFLLLSFHLSVRVYPSAISRIIIIIKPIAKAIVPISECLPCWVSGISSSTTTYSIAPAEKASK